MASRLLSLGVLLAFAAGSPWAAGSKDKPALEADVVYLGGRILTADSRFDVVQALAIRDGHVAALGRNATIGRLVGPHTHVVHLQGKTVLPGFYDAHVHLRIGPGPDVHDWRDIKDIEALRQRLRSANASGRAGEWINALLGFSWSESSLPERSELDQLVPDHPLDVMVGAHLMLVNSRAMRLAGITGRTPDPPGGKIIHDPTGEPNGWLQDAGAWRAIWALVPWTYPDDETVVSRIRDQAREWLAQGITSANVAGVRPYDRTDPYRYVDMPAFSWIQRLYASEGHELPRLTVQIRLFPGYEEHDLPDPDGIRSSIGELEALGLHTGFGDEHLKIGAVKLSLDGGDAGWTTVPYRSHPDFSGVIRIPESTFYQVAKRAKQLGWQLGIHVMGDAAAAMAVNVLERIYSELGPGDYRDYFHHISVLPSPATLRRMAQLHIAVCSQPNFLSYKPLLDALDGNQLERVSPQRSLLAAGLAVGYGSDSVPYSPLFGIWSAVTRIGIDGRVTGPDERISLREAIRAYTIGAAYLTHDELTRGSLEVGKVADMVILDRDILSVPPEEIRDLRVEQTIIGGNVVYSRSPVARSDRPQGASNPGRLVAIRRPPEFE